MNEEEYWFFLTNIEGVFFDKIKRLLDFFGSPWEVYKADEKALFSAGIKAEDIDRIVYAKRNFRQINKLDYLYNEGIRFLYPTHPAFPAKLKEIPDMPYSLYVKGNLPDENLPTLAMIGARAFSEYGRACAKGLASDFAGAGIQIISGLARGIDSISMSSAIDAQGRCFGVLGCGIDIIYPPENFKLFERTLEKGGIISEFPLGTKPLSRNFPFRNRIISALSDLVLVVEAKKKSGSLHTVEYALSQGKDVFALPGRISDLSSEACNALIADGAGIVTSSKDIFEYFGLEDKTQFFQNKKNNFSLAKDYEVLYSCVEFQPKTKDEIIEEAGIDYKAGLGALIKLEIDDLIYEPSPGYYCRN